MLIFNTFVEVLLGLLIVAFLLVKNRPKANIILGIYRKDVYLFWPKYLFILAAIKLQNVSGLIYIDRYSVNQSLTWVNPCVP